MKNMTRAGFLALALTLTLGACGGGSNAGGTAATAGGTADTAKGEGVMTYAEYAAAAVNDPVTIEAYVQGKQLYKDDAATIYAQDADGAYFIYGAKCSKEDYDKLVDGQKIKVTGFKAEWSGEIEIADVSALEIEEGNYIAEAFDATSLLGTDDLIKHQNEKVAFKGLTVAASKDASGNEVAFLYNYDGSGSEGDDLYFNVDLGGKTYSFTVEADLCDKDSDVYKAVTGLKVGDTIDAEGFLYWYEGANPHITSVTVK